MVAKGLDVRRWMRGALAGVVAVLAVACGGGDEAAAPVAVAAAAASQERAAALALSRAPGGPILVVTSSSSPFAEYYGEILRNEGLNAFAQADASSLSAAALAGHDVVLLGKTALTPEQVQALVNWVSGGGHLIAMAPDAQLAPLLGLAPAGSDLAEGYLLIDTAKSPGIGLAAQTLQYHGSAVRYTLAGAASVATLYSNATTPTSHPAVTTRSVGRGSASAFAYDLATSVVHTRQGNPAWAAQERDGSAPIRAIDKFYGNAATDPQPDWVDRSKVAIPQADEQQRLLANLILERTTKPLPRFWYFPHGKKAVVIMTGDDHGGAAASGTVGRFEEFKASSPAGCSVADWDCVRATAYVYTDSPLTPALAAAYTAQGFEIGLHVDPGCVDFDATSLQTLYANQLAQWRAKYPGLPPTGTQRHHCLAWSDWSTAARTQLAHGMRLDMSYAGWMADTPGLFTGSAMPMRFSALDGSLIDVYQAATQLSDDAGTGRAATADNLLDRALGAEGYFGAYTVNAASDVATSPLARAVVASARARGVPVVSARQMLDWLDARNSSSFGDVTWNGSALGFNLTAGAGANGLQAMLPWRFGTRKLQSLIRGGVAHGFSVRTIKGIDYAVFAGVNGGYVAAYAETADATSSALAPLGTAAPPLGAARTPARSFATAAIVSGWGNTAVPTNPSINETQPVELGVKFRTSVAGVVTGVRFYKGSLNTGTHTGSLWTAGGQLLATATFTNETATGWQQVSFSSPVAITANTVYVASYFAPNGGYAYDSAYFANNGVTNGALELLQNGVSGGNGVYAYGASSAFPSNSFNATNYWVDVVFDDAGSPPDTTPPTVTSTVPANGTTDVATTATIRVTFNEAIDSATVNSATFELRNASNALVTSTVSYNAATLTATLTPSAPLATGSSYTASVRGGSTDPRIKDVAGNALASTVAWSFTTSSSGSSISAFPVTATPGTPSYPETLPLEVGVKFRTDVSGFITGIRFYKGAGNTGTHSGNLWTSGGTRLAQATFTNESATGWQQVTFGAPVAIAANTMYVASYFAPNGGFAADADYFASAGVDNGVLHLLQNGVSGGNGVFAYGATGSFPSQTFNATNYWVDVVFTSSAGPDNTPPSVN